MITFKPTFIQVLCEVLRECLRLASRLTTPEDANPTFLDYTKYATFKAYSMCRTDIIIRDEEHSASHSSVMTCRVQALLLFASLAAPPFNHERHLPQLEGSGIKDLITLLVSLATLEAEDGDLSSVTSAAQLATTKVINAISAGEFLLAVTVTLRSTEPRVGPQR